MICPACNEETETDAKIDHHNAIYKDVEIQYSVHYDECLACGVGFSGPEKTSLNVISIQNEKTKVYKSLSHTLGK